MPIEEFYIDFAGANFGRNIAEPAGKIFAAIDGVQLPQASNWKGGPGALVPSDKPWAEMKRQYSFVEELAALRPQVQGAGNRERYDYWLNTYRAMSLMAEAECARGQLDQTMRAVTSNGAPASVALAQRIQLAELWSRLLSLQASIVSTPGELGTIANLEQHTRQNQHFIDRHDAELVKALGAPLPAEAAPARAYRGPAKIIVPTVRSSVCQGEALKLNILALDQEPMRQIAVKFRALGKGKWKTRSVTHLARAVYAATMTEAREDFEYYIIAETAAGEKLVWPPTAPAMNQTVVVTARDRGL